MPEELGELRCVPQDMMQHVRRAAAAREHGHAVEFFVFGSSLQVPADRRNIGRRFSQKGLRLLLDGKLHAHEPTAYRLRCDVGHAIARDNRGDGLV